MLDLVRSAAGGIDAAHQASHAGAGDQVHRHVVLVKPLQHADVRQPERTAPFEHQADLLPLRLHVLGRNEGRRESQEEYRDGCSTAS